MYDDYPAIFEFGLHYLAEPNWLHRLAWIFTYQYGDYKLIVENALVAVDLSSTHYFHLGFLIWCGNLLALGLGWVLWNMYFRDSVDPWRKLLYFLPIIYLIAQLSYTENFDWAMCGLQTIPDVLFSLAALWLLTERRKTGLACLLGVLAFFSSANALLLTPLGAVFLWKQWRPLALWCSGFAAALAIYFYRYFPVPLSSSTATHKFLYFLSFLGGAAENQHRWPVRYGATVLGLAFLAVLVMAWRRNFHRSHPAAYYSAAWIILTAAMVTRGRAYLPLHTALTMRYRIYSDLLLIFCYGFFSTLSFAAPRAGRLRASFYGPVLAFAVLFCTVSDVGGYRYLTHRRQRVDMGLEAYEADNTKSPYVNLVWGNAPTFYVTNARLSMNEVRRRNLYQIPALPHEITSDDAVPEP